MVTRAHAVVVRLCASKSSSRAAASRATASKSAGTRWWSTAHAHAKLLSWRGVKSAARTADSWAIASTSGRAASGTELGLFSRLWLGRGLLVTKLPRGVASVA